jgi:hypothetical protein
MSEERELLVMCRAAINIRYDQVMLIRLHHEIETLLGEVEELLEQPEQEREPLIYEHLEALVDKYHGYPMTLGRAIEKAHGIGGEE